MEQKKYYEQTFTIKDYTHQFRHTKISPPKLLALATTFGPDMNLVETETVFEFALENTEVLIVDRWYKVKETLSNNDSVYMPADIEDNLKALQEIISNFVANVLKVVFTSSNKLTK